VVVADGRNRGDGDEGPLGVALACACNSHQGELARIDRNVEERTGLRLGLDLAPAVGPA